MPQIKTLVCLSVLSFVTVRPGCAQNESCQHRTVPISAYDSQGRTIRGFAPSDFEAKYRKEPVRILSVVPDNRPHRVVILLDSSGGMGSVGRQALAAASDLAETQLPNTQVALIIFGEKINAQIDFSSGQSAVAGRLHQILSNENNISKFFYGRTAVFDSLIAGLRLLSNPTSADSLYLVSDAYDNSSHASFDQVSRQLNSSGVRLFLVAVFQPMGFRNRTPAELKGTGAIDILVRETGGEIIAPYKQGMPSNPREIAQISTAMKAFYSRMTKNDLVEIHLPLAVDKHEKWDLKFSPEKKKRFKGVELSYPTTLAPCES